MKAGITYVDHLWVQRTVYNFMQVDHLNLAAKLIFWYFTLKASLMSVHADSNVQSTDYYTFVPCMQISAYSSAEELWKGL